jgi:pimeloyl-ACP methyl ester carboxylesterase
MQTQRALVDAVGIQVEDHGGPNNAVLFLHHGGSNLRMWDPVVPFFARDYRCVALDLRGHGRSDAPATGYHIDDMAGDIVGVLDLLGIEQVHIVGSSIGAEVGLSVATQYPERMRSLVAEGAFHSEYGPYGTRDFESPDYDEALKLRLEERKSNVEKTYASRECLLEAKLLQATWHLDPCN